MAQHHFYAVEEKPRFAFEPVGRFALRSRIRLNPLPAGEPAFPNEQREDLMPIAEGLCAVAAALTFLDRRTAHSAR